MGRKNSLRSAFLLFLTASAFIASSALAADALCNRSGADLLQQAIDPAQRLSFENHGGLFNGGVCWWHSRFQRNALYLAKFRPELPKLSREDNFALIQRLRHFNVVEFPGYKNLQEFSKENEDLIQNELERWQLDDGTIGFGWIDGLEGESKYLAPELLKQSMDELFNLVVIHREIAFQKLQIPGITSHAWLVIDMISQGQNYQLKVIDSNYPEEVKTVNYRMGDTHVTMPYNGWTFIPYTERQNDFASITATLQEYCSSL